MHDSDLVGDLRERVRGEVRFEVGDRALYATDGSNYRQVPIGVVVPRSIEDVLATIELCSAYDVPLLSRGGGTSLAGQCCNEAVVMDFSKYLNRVISVDAEHRRAQVQPGVVLDRLRDAAEEFHLTFGPDPATHDHCTLGGMIGNNSCGVHSVMSGRTVDNIDALDIVTYDGTRMRVGATNDHELQRIIDDGGRRGQIYSDLRDLRDRYADEIRRRYPRIPRRVSGYNLDELLPENGFHVARALVGSESTCVTVLEATCELVHSPPARTLAVLGYEDVYAAADHVCDVMEHGPVALEGIDHLLVSDMRKKGLNVDDLSLLPDGKGWLIVEFGGETKEESDAQARKMLAALAKSKVTPTHRLYDDAGEEQRLWEVRESGLGATARVPGQPNTWPGWEDSAVAPEVLGDYLRGLHGLYEKYGYRAALYGHFGQGCVHTRIDFDLTTAKGIQTYRAFMDDATDLCLAHNGSLSGEHGDGQARAEFLPKMYGETLVRAFEEFKAIWDPRNKMNPGKVVHPYRIDENLRIGTDYEPVQLTTKFAYVDDHHDFAEAVNRCVGVGKCRRDEGGVMCPSYQVTKEEKHSTRGRARLLFEMLNGDEWQRGWKNDAVHEALDLCFACKGCKTDCPVNVDMATYKAEFYSHYYRGRLRPPAAYAMGFIMIWARLASRAPCVANFVLHAPLLGAAGKKLAGVAQQRQVPRFAKRNFTRSVRDRTPNAGGKRVILWPDTWNNYFHPQVAHAGLRVLEAAGYSVEVPKVFLCCGRPLYDFGFVDEARRRLKHVVRTLRDDIRAGVPVVGLEPSCVSVFRDELPNMLPDDVDAKRLSTQTFLLSEFLEREHVELPFAQRSEKAVVQGHCHHRSVLDFASEEHWMQRLGLDVEMPEQSCCGMAGSFGFEAGEHYDVSVKAGERHLLPAVRASDDGTVLIADGFSCREQVKQGTGREPRHFAEILAESIERAQEEK